MKSQKELQGYLSLLRIARRARPLLRLLGADLSRFDLDEMIEQGEGFSSVEESFNKLLVGRGWVAHGGMHHDAAVKALALAERGDFDQADEVLTAVFDDTWVRMIVMRLSGLKCFGRRAELAQLAAEDYSNDRYHACIPVVLLLLDGMGQELLGASFLGQGTNLASKDSFLELGPGLTALVKVMTCTRARTNAEDLNIPYRHGIMHGVDLGYANRVVAAKCWGALHAAGEYAVQVEQKATPDEPTPGLMETVRRYNYTTKKLQRQRELIDSWKIRDGRKALERFLANGPEAGSPEENAAQLLDAWCRRNYGAVALLTWNDRNDTTNAFAGRVRNAIGAPPESWQLTEINDEACAAASVSATLRYSDGYTEEVTLKLVFQNSESTAVPRGDPSGNWRARSLWPLEAVTLQRKARERAKR